MRTTLVAALVLLFFSPPTSGAETIEEIEARIARVLLASSSPSRSHAAPEVSAETHGFIIPGTTYGRPLPDGKVLKLFYSEDCVWCPEAYRNATRSGIAVEVCDVRDHVFELVNRWRDHDKEFAVPAWFLCDGDETLASWIGKSSPAGVRIMANWTPPVVQSSTLVAEATPIPLPMVPPDPRPGHWTFPGDIASHLRSHGIDPSGMSYEQMLTAHDLAHEQGWRPSRATVQYASPPVRYSRPVQYRAACPNCP